MYKLHASSREVRFGTWNALFLFLVAVCVGSAAAQDELAHTPTGLQASNAGLTLRVDALRPDLLRVRIFPGATPPEDASWAVLPEARTAKSRVTAEPTGFRTGSLRVTVSKDLRVTVADLAGNVLQSDESPVAWSSDGFKVIKHKNSDDHFFGLGDKPGPLDRAGESFVMWNSDSFGWQEYTDPIYKSIPFFPRDARRPHHRRAVRQTPSGATSTSAMSATTGIRSAHQPGRWTITSSMALSQNRCWKAMRGSPGRRRCLRFGR